MCVKFLCYVKRWAGTFQENDETMASAYFSKDDLPVLSEEKNTKEQIQMCFAAVQTPDWQVLFDVEK